MPVDATAIVDVGSNDGSTICDLALALQRPDISFFGCELQLNGQQSLAEYADMLDLDNVHSIDFNINSPRFDFIKGVRHAFMYSIGTLVYANPSPLRLFEELLFSVERVSCLLFEPVSYQLANEFGIKPAFSQAKAQSYGFSDTLWQTIKTLEQQGRIAIREVFPDFISPTTATVMSLIHFESKTR